MKRLIALLMAFVMIFSLAACGGDTDDDRDREDEDDDNDGTAFIQGNDSTTGNHQSPGGVARRKIKYTWDFSGGYTFVEYSDDDIAYHCIDTDGNVVFQLDQDLFSQCPTPDFYNGYAFLDWVHQEDTDGNTFYTEAILDTDGNLVFPSDVGAEKFCGEALEGGFIIVEVWDRSVTPIDHKLGVMNTNFEWVYAPTVELYNEFGGISEISSTSTYYANVLYLGRNRYWDLLTGEITDTVSFSTPSDKWDPESKGEFEDWLYDTMLDLEELDGFDNLYSTQYFHNGKVLVIFYDSGVFSVTLVDEKGMILFTPIQLSEDYDNFSQSLLGFDGNYLLVHDTTNGVMCTYDCAGNIVGTLDTSSLGSYSRYSARISEGVIVVYLSNTTIEDCMFFTPKFEPLF